MVDLTPFDYRILDFINKCESATTSEITKHFNTDIDTIEYRLDNLSAPKFNGRLPPYIIELTDIQHDELGGEIIDRKGIYHLSDLGKKVLHDYRLEKKAELRRKQEEWAWRLITIAISLAAFLNSAGYLGFHK